MTTALLLTLTLAAPAADEGEPPADPTRPALVTLDFRNRPTAEVVRELARRSGCDVEALGSGPGAPSPLLTLESPEPVPFWEAVDRLAAAAKLQRALAGPGMLGRSRTFVQLHGPSPGVDFGPALYVGPLRLGEFALHAHHTRTFVARPPLGPDFGPAFAEFRVLVEPRVIALLLGPPRHLEATGDDGRDLIDPKIASGATPIPVIGHELNGPGLVRIPLLGPAEPGRTLKHLRGVLPLEVGIRPEPPALEIDLATAVDKTFRAGDVELTVHEYRGGEQSPTRLKFTGKITGARGEARKAPQALASARGMNVLYRQLEFLDAQGRPAATGSGGASAPGGRLQFEMIYSPPRPDSPEGPPTRLRLYAPRWVEWEAPFEFSGLPLP